MKVDVKGNNVERALRTLKRKLAEDGLFRELQARRFYEKPSDARRRKKRAAIARQKREDATRREERGY